ncbi:MAG: acetyl-CoA carboxylase biotin carboxylase subunit [Chlorobi bacterium]|nr:acetyl-CoA carboxylase biotin carboxylase subunit [Chlorobiota bacterium]
MHKTFNKILIANRGEIAVRIIRSVKELGIRTIAVYSEVDKGALHVKNADEAYCLGHSELSETYLNIEKIIAVAKKSGCDAIHPGYGFLAENSLFVQACNEAGLVFIGPHERAMKLMGNKIESRKFVEKLGIPMTKGITGTPEKLAEKAASVGFPVLVKAAAGGGGKGMRIVREAAELENILETTSREAKNYFGDGTIYIEKYIEEPRHIEFQVLGDNHGNVVHLFERECTIQRRYQKIIEESPSPTLTPEIRQQMGEAAVRIAKAVKYNSAGTVEFLVDKNLNYYFLEMNTRIQVEHPVTEMITGVDLVKEQILVARGNKLRLKQEDLAQSGHAIECRIYAEDPANDFMPSPGKMSLYEEPAGENIRVDSGIDSATEIHSFFDPMIAKLIVWGENRSIATERTVMALKDFTIHGIQTNISYLLGILRHPAFRKNQLSTKFCDEHTKDIVEKVENEKEETGIRYPVFAYILHNLNANRNENENNIWKRIGYWRNIMEIPIESNGNIYWLKIERAKNNSYEFLFNDEHYDLHLEEITGHDIRFTVDDHSFKAFVSTDDKSTGWVSMEGMTWQLVRKDILNNSSDFSGTGQGNNESNLFAPMPGKVIKINVKEGDRVKRGTILLVVEAMKMENNITAECEAVVEKIVVREGDMVDTDLQLVYLEKTLEE